MKETVLELIFFVLIFTGCSKNVPDVSVNILDYVKFNPNQWENIVIGETSETYLAEQLQTMPQIEKGSIVFTGTSWEVFDNTIRFMLGTDNDTTIRLEGETINDEVVSLTFCGDFHTSISNIIKEIGEPLLVSVTEGGEVGGSWCD